ncbi:hypothetical protein TVNIR_2328 [Thioalkalivibrio nitratireducens DSM 14787]|uniref:Uncharacterized protein n=1 Tax=Thioalkalivibrio nitratireducens (strain DSM 14787 / UNIQEM 213 / ALEN2) TaxID=1255043 RepID=L0E026_THIND|nr:hypothetical protein TVNIR_2328 [Thioalkalivibrio nitratireducens DSM 14787]
MPLRLSVNRVLGRLWAEPDREDVFMHSGSELAVTIPFKRPIKPIYITQFLALLDDIGAE